MSRPRVGEANPLYVELSDFPRIKQKEKLSDGRGISDYTKEKEQRNNGWLGIRIMCQWGDMIIRGLLIQ
jgi:hypothetical protein